MDEAAPPAAPSAAVGLRFVSLGLRVFTFILLLISLIVLCTNVETWSDDDYFTEFELSFIRVKAYQYMLSAIVIGSAYILMQIAVTIYSMVMKTNGLLLVDFYGDKLVSYLLATGAAAGFGITVDGKDLLDGLLDVKLTTFYAKAYASASLLLVAFLCTSISSILSSFALIPKPV